MMPTGNKPSGAPVGTNGKSHGPFGNNLLYGTIPGAGPPATALARAS
jgi:hypothetical protein